MTDFLHHFFEYTLLIIPGLLCGFFLTAIIHEILPDFWIKQNVGQKGLKPILYATISGTLLPLCTWAEIPLAISFYKRGARLGAVLAFLLTAPATSFIALILTYQLLGLKFFFYIFFAVVCMGIIVGVIGDHLKAPLPNDIKTGDTDHSSGNLELKRERFFSLLFSITRSRHNRKTFGQHIKSAFRYAFVDLLKEIGPGILVGILLAAFVDSFAPLFVRS